MCKYSFSVPSPHIYQYIIYHSIRLKGHGEKDNGKFMQLKEEYERYKDLWGLNLQHSHTAGPSQNYSKSNLLESITTL